MKNHQRFTTKNDENVTVSFSMKEIEEIIPDADMRYSLVILKNGDKHFICGTKAEIHRRFTGESDGETQPHRCHNNSA